MNMKIKRWIAGGCLLLLIQGCSSLQSYTRKTNPARVDIESGDFSDALSAFPEKSATGNNEILIRLERGVILQNMGEFKQSAGEFEQADKKIKNFENKAVISASKTLSETGTLLVNEQVMPYEGKDYEKILLHAYDAINYLMLGNLSDSRVEVRKAYEQQEILSAKHEKALEKAEQEAGASDWQNSFEQADPQTLEELRHKAASVYSVYHNAFASYISSLVYELNGEPDEAYIDLKKAIVASPDSKSIQQDLIRLAKKLNYKDDLTKWETEFGSGKKIPEDAVDVVMIFSYGLGPYKQSLDFPIPIHRGFVFASLPVYRFTPSSISSGELESQGIRVDSSTVFDTDAVAARNLLDDFPIIFAKQIVRSYIKARATRELADNINFGFLLGTLYSMITERADLRTWSSLPKEIQVARAFMPRSVKRISIKALPAGPGTSVSVAPNTSHMIILCRVTDTGITIHTRFFSVKNRQGGVS